VAESSVDGDAMVGTNDDQSTMISRRVPLLPRLQNFKIWGLSGGKLRSLIQYREKAGPRLAIHRCGDNKDESYGVQHWMASWNPQRKGEDIILDMLVEDGFQADSGRMVKVVAFDDGADDDDEDVDGADDDIGEPENIEENQGEASQDEYEEFNSDEDFESSTDS